MTRDEAVAAFLAEPGYTQEVAITCRDIIVYPENPPLNWDWMPWEQAVREGADTPDVVRMWYDVTLGWFRVN